MTVSSEGLPGVNGAAASSAADVVLGPPAPIQDFSSTALFLDFDGTLVEIADHPDRVVVPADLPDLVTRLSRKLEGRLAIVTGRSISAFEALFGPADIPVAGSHGGEFRAAPGAAIEPLTAPIPAAVVTSLHEFARKNGGLLVEPKPSSAAVHYRHHPEAFEMLSAHAGALAAEFGLRLKHGKQVIELTVPGSDKGKAVSRFMDLPDFRRSRPIFVGDDVTDEDAFAAVRLHGGSGILVGASRPTAATFRLEGVAEVHGWLQSSL